MIVVSQDGDNPVTGAEAGEHVGDAGNPFAAIVDEIAGKGDEVGAERIGSGNAVTQEVSRIPSAVVEVGKVDDAEAVETQGQPLDQDLL